MKSNNETKRSWDIQIIVIENVCQQLLDFCHELWKCPYTLHFWLNFIILHFFFFKYFSLGPKLHNHFLQTFFHWQLFLSFRPRPMLYSFFHTDATDIFFSPHLLCWHFLSSRPTELTNCFLKTYNADIFFPPDLFNWHILSFNLLRWHILYSRPMSLIFSFLQFYAADIFFNVNLCNWSFLSYIFFHVNDILFHINLYHWYILSSRHMPLIYSFLQTYAADIFFGQSWDDHRLKLPANMTTDYRLLPVEWLEHIWRPDSFFKNAKQVNTLDYPVNWQKKARLKAE